MKNTVLVELKNDNALNLLKDLEKMDIIHIINNAKSSNKIDIASKFAGILSKEQAESLKAHVKLSREEWDSRI